MISLLQSLKLVLTVMDVHRVGGGAVGVGVHKTVLFKVVHQFRYNDSQNVGCGEDKVFKKIKLLTACGPLLFLLRFLF